MKRNGLVALFVAVIMMSFQGTSLFAQISEARIQELMRQAAQKSQAQSPLTFSAQAPSGGGPGVDLTLEDAIRFALERNLDIAVQRMNPELQDITVAAAQAVMERRDI